MSKIIQNPQLAHIYFPKDKQTPLQAKKGREIISTRAKIRTADGSHCDGYRQEYLYTMEELTMLMHINMEDLGKASRARKQISLGINILKLKENQKQAEIQKLTQSIVKHMEDLTAQRQAFLQTADQYLAGTLEGTGSMTKLILDTLNGHKEELGALHAELKKIAGKN